MDIQESALIEAARRGDSEAFGVIVSRYMPKALAFARRMTGDDGDAEDVVQDAFIKAYKAIGSFKAESGFGTWFYRILANQCLDHLRKATFFRRVFFFAYPARDEEGQDGYNTPDFPDPAGRPDEELEQKQLKKALNKAVMGLPERQRAVFLLKHDEGLKISEIAVILGITEGAAKSHLSRAAAALRDSMKAHRGR